MVLLVKINYKWKQNNPILKIEDNKVKIIITNEPGALTIDSTNFFPPVYSLPIIIIWVKEVENKNTDAIHVDITNYKKYL